MSVRHRILVTGGAGQVGLELARTAWPADVEVVRPSRSELDVVSPGDVDAFLQRGDWAAVVNCAAWTAVDLAEEHVSDAFLANAQGPANLAEAAHRIGVPIIHISTDYVFDGTLDRPYKETDPVAPLGAYGASKLAGELAVRCANPRSVILRTAWVLSAHRANFLKTMLRIGAVQSEIRVVADQYGCPTCASDIAAVVAKITMRLIEDHAAPTGTYHFVNAGEASWHELASAIFDAAAPLGGPNPLVTPIAASDYPTRARRPANSRLDTDKLTADFRIEPRPWLLGVAEIVTELASLDQCKGTGV